jgi:hypothetical protein
VVDAVDFANKKGDPIVDRLILLLCTFCFIA